MPNNKLNSPEDTDKANFNEVCQGYTYTPPVLPIADKIVAFGDLHGDYQLTIDCLKLARVIDDNLNWTGGKTVVVQVGDQVDRCRPGNKPCSDPASTVDDENSDIKIMELMTELDKQAINTGGRVISLIGNHEIMNISGDMRYVSYEGLKGFTDKREMEDCKKNTDCIAKLGTVNRKKAFKDDYTRFIACTRLPCIIVGDLIFVHAGVIPNVGFNSRSSLYSFNTQVRKWILSLADNSVPSPKVDVSVFWTRVLGNIPAGKEPVECEKYLKPVLKMLDLKGMVIGHTPQIESGVNSTCGNKLWRVDHGASKAFNKFKTDVSSDKKTPQVLQIVRKGSGYKFTVLK